MRSLSIPIHIFLCTLIFVLIQSVGKAAPVDDDDKVHKSLSLTVHQPTSPPPPPSSDTRKSPTTSLIYEAGQQFPAGSEHLILPRITTLSIYFGKLSYPHFGLTLESMRLNPRVNFHLINIVNNTDPDSEDLHELSRLVRRKNVKNFHLRVYSFNEFSAIVKTGLGIDVVYNNSWGYKVGTDYKPTLAYLFPELVDEKDVDYWAYVDSDVVWGNFSRFSHLFQGEYSVVTSEYNRGISGVCTFFKNKDWTRSMFMKDDKFVNLLTHTKNYLLDEFLSDGPYSSSTMDKIIPRVFAQRNQGDQMNLARHWKDKLWIEAHGANEWAGPVIWSGGKISVIKETDVFPPGHEFLLFHRPTKGYNIFEKFPRRVALEIEEDMLEYGYILPNFVPVLTRHICVQSAVQWTDTASALDTFQPYKAECFGKHDKHHVHELKTS